MRHPLLAWALLGLAGCLSGPKATDVCPESRNIHCLTKVECAYDRKRGCQVCQCTASPHHKPAPPETDRPADR